MSLSLSKSLNFAQIPLVKIGKKQKKSNFQSWNPFSPWRAALGKKLFWTFFYKYCNLKTTKISAFLDPPFSFSTITPQICAIFLKFWNKVKILVVLHQLQKEWILFYLKWAWNDFLHLKTSEMSIDMGSGIVQWVSDKVTYWAVLDS